LQDRTIQIRAFGQTHDVKLNLARYGNNRLAIQLMFRDGEPWGVLTVNIHDKLLADNEIFVKTWSENEAWVYQVLEQCPDLFEDTDRVQCCGYTQAEVWRIKGELLEEVLNNKRDLANREPA